MSDEPEPAYAAVEVDDEDVTARVLVPATASDPTLERVVELEVQVRRFADRVEQLFRQRQGLVALLRSIKTHGGVTERDWAAVDRILAAGEWDKVEDSGRH